MLIKRVPSIYALQPYMYIRILLTHWGRVTHICVGNLTIIGSDNGLSPDRRQAITWTNVVIFLIGSLGTNFSEMSIEIHAFSFTKIHLKMSSGKWRQFCVGLNVLRIFSAMIIFYHWGVNMASMNWKDDTLAFGRFLTSDQLQYSYNFIPLHQVVTYN